MMRMLKHGARRNLKMGFLTRPKINKVWTSESPHVYPAAPTISQGAPEVLECYMVAMCKNRSSKIEILFWVSRMASKFCFRNIDVRSTKSAPSMFVKTTAFRGSVEIRNYVSIAQARADRGSDPPRKPHKNKENATCETS